METLGQYNIATPAKDYSGPCRDKAQSVVADLVKQHERELPGWNYLQLVMAKEPPNQQEEAALHEIFSRARRERY